jgi:hypothetical protein
MYPISILGSLTGFICLFVGVYYCRRRPQEFKIPDPIVIVRREENPGDPS